MYLAADAYYNGDLIVDNKITTQIRQRFRLWLVLYFTRTDIPSREKQADMFPESPVNNNFSGKIWVEIQKCVHKNAYTYIACKCMQH